MVRAPRTVTAALAEVFEHPDDLALRAVVADVLQQHGHPQGELIAAQLARPTPATRKRARDVLAAHLADLVGPIGRVASLQPAKKCLVFERGFLAECTLDRRQVPRAAWEEAARAPEWATVHSVHFSVLTTPQWWVAAWAKNPAATRSLRVFDVSNALLLVREADQPWTLMRATPRSGLRRPPAPPQFVGGALAGRARAARGREPRAREAPRVSCRGDRLTAGSSLRFSSHATSRGRVDRRAHASSP